MSRCLFFLTDTSDCFKGTGRSRGRLSVESKFGLIRAAEPDVIDRRILDMRFNKLRTLHWQCWIIVIFELNLRRRYDERARLKIAARKIFKTVSSPERLGLSGLFISFRA